MIVNLAGAPAVNSFVTMEGSFETSYLLSPHQFDGVVYGPGKMLPPPFHQQFSIGVIA